MLYRQQTALDSFRGFNKTLSIPSLDAALCLLVLNWIALEIFKERLARYAIPLCNTKLITGSVDDFTGNRKSYKLSCDLLSPSVT